MFGLSSLPRNLEAALRDARSPAASERVRTQAVHELVPHAGEARARVVRALEEALGDEAPSVRAAAALALADVGAKEALPKLLLSVEDEHGSVRESALTALGELGDPRATQRLRRALGDPRPEVRFQAVMAFPRVCASRGDARQALHEACKDPDPRVQHIALRMLEELGELEADEGTLDTPADLPSDTHQLARGLLRGGPPRVRAAAALLLARSGESAVHEVLVEIACGGLEGLDPEDEAAGIEWAGDLGLHAAIPGLERRAFGGLLGLGRDRFGWHARVALARLGHPKARESILRELRSWQRPRRTLAVAAAGRAHLLEAEPLLRAWLGDPSRVDQETLQQALRSLQGSGGEGGSEGPGRRPPGEPRHEGHGTEGDAP